MRTQTLKKLSAVILAVMMMIGLISGMTVSAAAIAGRDYANGVKTLGNSGAVTIGASQIGIWGYNGITSADAADWTSGAGIVTVDAATRTITIDLTNAIDKDSSKYWAKKGAEFTLGIAPTDASTATKSADYDIMFYGVKVGTDAEIAVCSDATWKVVSRGIDVDAVTPTEALAVDLDAGNKLFTAFVGYEFTLTSGGTTYKYSDKTTKLSGTATDPIITFENGDADLADDAQVVATATGTKVLANQNFYFNGKEAKAGKVLAFRDAKTTATTYGITYKTAKKATTPAVPTALPDFDAKVAAIIAELGAATVDCSGTKKFADLGIVVTNKTVSEHLTTISINLYNNAMPSDIKVKIPKGTVIAKDFEYTLTKTDETIIVPLVDGTFTFLNVKCTSNLDYVTPLTAADVTLGLGNGALLDLTNLMTFKDKALDGTNKTIFVDAIFARAGQSTTYFDKDGKVTTKVDDFKKLKTIIAYRGFKADGSRGVADINNRIVNKFWYDNTLVANATTDGDVWSGGKYFNFSYTLGGELINETIQPVNQYNTIKVTSDGNDYIYTIMVHGRYAELTVNAVGLGVKQLVDAKLTGAGDTFYRILTAGANTAPAGALAADEYGFAVGNIERTEKNAEITLTNYTAELGGDYNKAGTVLSFRAPYGTTITLTSGTGVVATALDRAKATIGDTGADGLVDYFVKIDYSTLSDSTFTMKLTYADGVSRTYDVISKFVTKAEDVKKFAASFGATIVPVLAETPESPIKPNDPPMSEPSSASVVESSVAESSTPVASSDTSTDIGDYGNPFNAMAYIITIAASAIGGISTLVIRKRK